MKFNKIIHVDCSRWKSRRALQRTIAQELKLHQWVMDIFDRQDEEDDFGGIDEGSRVDIELVGREILQTLMGQSCLVIFHNGSNGMVNISDYGIPQGKLYDNKVLWTFRGRFRLNSRISEKVDTSNLFIYNDWPYKCCNYFLQNETREIDGYTDNVGATVEECCLYLLSLNSQGGNIGDYNWATHASSYWVCDGIIHGGEGDEAWEVAAALHQQRNIEDYSSNVVPSFGDVLETPPKRWILSKDSSVVHPESTSFFLAAVASESDHPLKLHQTYVTMMDLRFFQSLVLQTNVLFCWKSTRFHLNLYVPCTTNVNGQCYMKEKMGPGNSGQIMGPPRPKSLAPNTYTTYIDVSVGNIIIDHDYNNGMQFPPSSCHVVIGKGISNAKVESEQVIRATMFAMDNVESLHVHDNSSIIIVIPEYMTSIDGTTLGWRHLKQCHVVRCPKLHTVFTPNYNRIYPFKEIETFWAADMLNAHCIWSKGRSYGGTDSSSFVSIHLYSCPRLTFVLPLLMVIEDHICTT